MLPVGKRNNMQICSVVIFNFSSPLVCHYWVGSHLKTYIPLYSSTFFLESKPSLHAEELLRVKRSKLCRQSLPTPGPALTGSQSAAVHARGTGLKAPTRSVLRWLPLFLLILLLHLWAYYWDNSKEYITARPHVSSFNYIYIYLSIYNGSTYVMELLPPL